MKTLASLSLPSVFVLVTLAALAGCMSSYRVSPIRSGALYPSKGAACKVQFQNLNFQEGSAKYENLGLVSLTGASTDEFTPEMKKDVERAACKMGGDAVSLNASAPGIFQFIVWRSR
jgi:hypothetical protein